MAQSNIEMKLLTNSYNHDLVMAKVASLFILGFAALFCAVLPIILTRYFGRKKTQGNGLSPQTDFWLGLFLRFGGGILLATTFIHLLPEVREGIEKLGIEDWPVQIPELVMCIGFFIMYAIEEVAHVFLHNGSHGHGHSHELERPSSPRDDSHIDHSHNHHHHETQHEGHHQPSKQGHSHLVSSTPIRALLIVIALSVHQIFEGMAIGLETDLNQVWVLLGAVAAHKLVIAICVGAEMASTNTKFLTATLCVSMFAIASPIGIALGIWIRSAADDNSPILNTVSVILQGLATGTLMYVVFFEVLTKVDNVKLGLLYCAATFIGFCIMLGLLIAFES